MIKTDSKTGETIIEGDGKVIEEELITIMADIIHCVLNPIGVDPVFFMAKCFTLAMALSEDDKAFNNGTEIRMFLPRKENEDSE